MKCLNRRTVSLILIGMLLFLFPLTAMAVEDKVLPTNVIEVLQQSGLSVSTNVELSVEYSKDSLTGNQNSFLTLTEHIDNNTIRKTIVVPYEEVEGSLQIMDAKEYVAYLEKATIRDNGSVGTTAISNPVYSFNGLTLYLSCYYQKEYVGDEYRAYAYRVVNLDAKATSGTGSVTNFMYTASLGGAYVLLNPYREYGIDYQWADSLVVNIMTIGTPYSKICDSISPYYICTHQGQMYQYALTMWYGTYNGISFESGIVL